MLLKSLIRDHALKYDIRHSFSQLYFHDLNTFQKIFPSRITAITLQIIFEKETEIEKF